MPKSEKSKSEKEGINAEDIIGTFLKGDRYSDDERYRQSVNAIYRKLKPIWLNECKDAIWLLKDEYVREVASILYLDDQMGGNLDPSSLSEAKQNLLGWTQVQNSIERYRATDYSLVDDDSIKAILSSIIKNKKARDADRLKAIEQYTNLFGGEGIEGVTFLNDLYKGDRGDRDGRDDREDRKDKK